MNIKLDELETSKKKIFIGRNQKDVDIVLKNYIRENPDRYIANFEQASILSLAKNVLVAYGFDSSKFIENDLAVLLMDKFINEQVASVDNKILDLIPVSSKSIKTSQMVYETINRVRGGKIINNDNKIDNLIFKYEEYLNNLKLLDSELVIKTAIKKLNENSIKNPLNLFNPQFIVLPNLVNHLKYNETEFLTSLIGVYGQKEFDVLKLEMSSNTNLTLVEAYGFGSEINYIVKTIKEQKYKTGDVAIYCADSSYENMIKGIFDVNDIPHAFINGTSPLCNNVIALANDVLDFLDNHYSIAYLSRIYDNQAINNKEVDGAGLPIIYVNPKQLNNLSADKEAILKAVQDLTIWNDNQRLFLGNILKIGESDSLEELFNSLVLFLEKYVDKETGEEIIQKLKTKNAYFVYFNDAIMTFSEKVNYIKKIISSIKIPSYKDEASVEILSLKGSTYIAKKNVFCIGLSASQMEEKCYDSPLICDEDLCEMLDASYYIELAKNKNDETIQTFRNFLLSKESANVYLSYSKYDSVRFTELSRWAELNKHKFIKFEERSFKDDGCNINATPSLVKDIPIFDSESLDILNKSIHILSASKVDTIYECPLHYFGDILYEKKEYDEYDATWLKANEEGSLLHKCLENYFKERNNLADPFDLKVFNKAFKDAVNEQEQEKPFDSKEIKDRTIENNKKLLINYLNEELNDRTSNWRVLCCEKKFKGSNYSKLEREIKARDTSEYDKEQLERHTNLLEAIDYIKKVTFKGTIDRVDYRDDGGVLEIRIIDYKSSKEKTFKDGFHSQHAIYPLFIDQIVNAGKDIIERTLGSAVSLTNYQVQFAYRLIKVPQKGFDKTNEISENIDEVLLTLRSMFKIIEDNTLQSLNDNMELDTRTVLSTGEFSKSKCRYCTHARECVLKLFKGEDRGIGKK